MIGGEYYYQPINYVEQNLGIVLGSLGSKINLFSTGRDALYALLVELKEKKILLPDFICKSVYDAARAANKDIIFYTIESLEENDRIVDGLLDEETCIYIMHYFGVFNKDILRYKDKKVTIVSDVTHLLLNIETLKKVFIASDYCIASLRKIGPFPDGGFVLSADKKVPKPKKEIRYDFLSKRVAGLFARGFAAREGFINDENFILLKTAEEILKSSQPNGSACSNLTKLLMKTFNIGFHSVQAKKNISILYDSLKEFTPIYFSQNSVFSFYLCLFKDEIERDNVRNHLASNNIYCPIHWETSWLPKPNEFSQRCLSIPCDSRYDTNDMRKISREILSCF